MTSLTRRLVWILPALAVTLLAAGLASSQAPARGHGAEAQDMELVGHDDLQGRSAYQPTIHRQGGRVLAYVGHHGGRARNPLTGGEEDNGTSIVDVTDPARPRYLDAHPGRGRRPRAGRRADGARVRPRRARPTCCGRSATRRPTRVTRCGTSPTRSSRRRRARSSPASPRTHKNWWECDTGIAYLISGDRGLAHRTDDEDLRSQRSHPAGLRPRLRAGGPGARRPAGRRPARRARADVLGNRVYFAYGTSTDGMLQIVDRQKLLGGPKEPTAANLTRRRSAGSTCRPTGAGTRRFPCWG